MRRFAALTIVTMLALPAVALAKQGAMFNPQLSELPAGRATTLSLLLSPVDLPGRRRIPVPPAGAIPTVVMRLLGGHTLLRFRGTPLRRTSLQGGPLTSTVRITMPSWSGQRQWTIAVSAAGRLYPDLIDGPVWVNGTPTATSAVPTSNQTATTPVPSHHAKHPASVLHKLRPLQLVVLLGALLLFAWLRSRRHRPVSKPLR